ncbi:hypothetical protein ACTFIZ_008327 [Dictyostelium cf. discoideum]
MSENNNFKNLAPYKYFSKLKVVDTAFITRCLNNATNRGELSSISNSTIDLPFKFSDNRITGWKYYEMIPFTLDQLFIRFLVSNGDLWLIDVDKWDTHQILVLDSLEKD